MRYVIFIIFFSVGSIAFSQNFLSWKYSDRYFSLSAGTGTASYFGELNERNSINDRISLSTIALESRLLNRISARIDASYFSLNGDDKNARTGTFEQQRNLNFESRNLMLQISGIYYLKPYRGDYFKRWKFDPYLHAGFGFLWYSPFTELGSEKFFLRNIPTENETYKTWTNTVPFGFGMKFKANEFINVNLEFSYALTFSDYLDDVSSSYPEEFTNLTTELLSDRKDEIGVINEEFYEQIRPGSLRGDPSTKDSFLFISVKFEIFIPPGIFARKEPVLKKPSAY